MGNFCFLLLGISVVGICLCVAKLRDDFNELKDEFYYCRQCAESGYKTKD